jgi:hypothetical protein
MVAAWAGVAVASQNAMTASRLLSKRRVARFVINVVIGHLPV